MANKPYLMFFRGLNDTAESWYALVAEVDGNVINAFFQTKTDCTLYAQSLEGGKYAYSVIPVAVPAPGQIEALLAGDIGSLPAVVLSNPIDTSHTGWEVSSNWLVRIKGKLWARPWSSAQEVLVQSAALDPEGLSAHIWGASGDAVFWEVGGLKYRGIMGWTLSGGAQPIARFFGDYTQGAGNFGTDGVDMVWTHGEGKAPNDSEYPTRSIMTAPFATDSTVVKQKSKRLRSDPDQLSTNGYVVGCGYAARTITADVDASSGASIDLLVVRLSDGVSWIVDAPPVSSGTGFVNPLGFTCEELYARFNFPDDQGTVVRIRLDSLGPGMAPD